MSAQYALSENIKGWKLVYEHDVYSALPHLFDSVPLRSLMETQRE
jgi:hypothetical protein